jgi:hypothetical protein
VERAVLVVRGAEVAQAGLRLVLDRRDELRDAQPVPRPQSALPHDDWPGFLLLHAGLTAVRPASSEIPAELIQAYRATDYLVLGQERFSLRIGRYSRELANLYRLYSVDSAQYLTAWNPWSQRASDVENKLAHAALVAEVEKRSLVYLPGEGIDMSGVWPGEISLLILGGSLEAGKALGRQYHQNAFVWASADATLQLVLLR